MRTLFTIAFFFLFGTVTVLAQVVQQKTEDQDLQKNYFYQWTDEKGVVHITDGLGKVPKKYRDKAVKLETSKDESAVEDQQPQETINSPHVTEEEIREQDRKALWQGRMKDAKKKLAELKQRYQELDQKRNELLMSWGGPASGRLGDRVQAEQIAEKMKEVQKEIDAAQNEIEEVIPDEARKAGVPPGWLRE